MLWPGLRLCSNGFFTPSSSSTHSTTIYTQEASTKKVQQGRRWREDSVINLGALRAVLDPKNFRGFHSNWRLER